MLSSRGAGHPGVVSEWCQGDEGVATAAAAHITQDAYCSGPASSVWAGSSARLLCPFSISDFSEWLRRMQLQHMNVRAEKQADGGTSASFPLGISDLCGWATSSHCTIAMLSLMMVEPSL